MADFDKVNWNQPTKIQVPRKKDRDLIESVRRVAEASGLSVLRIFNLKTLFSNETFSIDQNSKNEAKLAELIAAETILIASVTFQLNSGMTIQVQRQVTDSFSLAGNRDDLTFNYPSNESFKLAHAQR
jgi:hypothetical protein